MTFLCIGAGAESEYFINKALAKGYKVIAIDGDKNAKCMSRKDIITYHIDLKDTEEILKIAKKHNINAILPVPLGSIITTSGYVNSKLNIKGISYEACLNFTDKAKVNQIQRQNNLNYPKQYQTNEIYKINFPCIIKPRNGSGSKDVKIIYTKEDLLLNMRDDILIEEFIDGEEYSVNALIKDSKIYEICIFQKELTPYPYRQEVCYFSHSLDNKIIKNIYDYVLKNALAIGINNSLVNCDLKITNDERFYVLDISARPGGNYVYLFLEMLNKSAIDLYIDMIIENRTYNLKDNDRKIYAHFFDMDGVVLSLPNSSNYSDLFIINNIKLGDILDEVKCGKDLLYRGCVIGIGDNLNILKNRCKQYLKEIKVEKN